MDFLPIQADLFFFAIGDKPGFTDFQFIHALNQGPCFALLRLPVTQPVTHLDKTLFPVVPGPSSLNSTWKVILKGLYTEREKAGGISPNEIVFSDITPSYVRFYVRAGQTDKDGGYVSFWGPDPWPGVVWFHFQDNGVMYANNQFLGAYTANTWYKIEFRNINFTTDTYDVYVDDVLAIDDRAMNGAVDAFGAVAIYNIDAGSQFYYDDILIQE
jgi:hypothetical protein